MRLTECSGLGSDPLGSKNDRHCRNRTASAWQRDLEAVHSGRWGNVVQAAVVEQGNETNSNWGALGYLEGGYKGERLSAYLRLTGFSVSDWAARIYCYERDAPGTFSVPAYSGRGIAVSAYGGWKHRFPRWFILKIYLRAAFTWRPGRDFTPSFRLQLQADR